MKFTDFNPADLVGKLVLVSTGNISTNHNRIAKITKATKTKIEIEGTETSYNYHGSARGGDSGRSSWGSHNEIKLITEERAKELITEWKKKREMKEMREFILDEMKGLTHEQLTQITKIIKP